MNIQSTWIKSFDVQNNLLLHAFTQVPSHTLFITHRSFRTIPTFLLEPFPLVFQNDSHWTFRTIPTCLLEPFPQVFQNHSHRSFRTIPTDLSEPFPQVFQNHSHRSFRTIATGLLEPFPQVFQNHSHRSFRTITASLFLKYQLLQITDYKLWYPYTRVKVGKTNIKKYEAS